MIIDEIRHLSDSALGRLTGRFGEPPSPVLAVIGASDVAADTLVRLRDYLTAPEDAGPEDETDGGGATADGGGATADGGDAAGGDAADGGAADGDDDRAATGGDQAEADAADGSEADGDRFAAADAEARRIWAVTETAVRRLARDVPDRAQQALADLPARAQEIANALRPDRLRDTAETASRRFTDTVDDLVERGRDHVQRASAEYAERSGG